MYVSWKIFNYWLRPCKTDFSIATSATVQQLSAWTWTQERAELTGALLATCYFKCFLQVFANVHLVYLLYISRNSSWMYMRMCQHLGEIQVALKVIDFAFNLPDVFPSRIRIHSLMRPSLSLTLPTTTWGQKDYTSTKQSTTQHHRYPPD